MKKTLILAAALSCIAMSAAGGSHGSQGSNGAAGGGGGGGGGGGSGIGVGIAAARSTAAARATASTRTQVGVATNVGLGVTTGANTAAGGLNPDSVAAAVAAIGAADEHYWIDMETGVRDENDRFSLDKCRAVCEAVYGRAAA